MLKLTPFSLLLAFFAGCQPSPTPIAPIETSPVDVRLTEVATGFKSPTDVQFVPREPSMIVVLEQAGQAFWYDLAKKEKGALFSVAVETRVEEGLLGLAFHPRYPDVPCFYINYVTRVGTQDTSRVAEWCGTQSNSIRNLAPSEKRTILEQEQPYANHNAGMLLFGPDGNFYIPWGDGGSSGDPHGHGQNLQTWLGSILRVRLTEPGSSPSYTIPSDNPFVSHPTARKEIWAYGMRNPWRGSFDDKGRLVVGDVGQDQFEEISIVAPGGNHGWNCKEGSHDFSMKGTCASQTFVDPIFEYGHDVGVSVTGGFQWQSTDAPSLKGLYVFGDFDSGRIWALELPEKIQKAKKSILLGKFDVAPVTFARDVEGRIYVADYNKGSIFRLTATAK